MTQVDKSIDGPMVASRLVRLMWERDYQTACKEYHIARHNVRSVTQALCPRWGGTLDPNERKSLRMVASSLQKDIRTNRQLRAALRSLVYRYQVPHFSS